MNLGLWSGPRYFLEGFRLIRQPGIRLFVILPLLLNSGLFILFTYLFGRRFSGWVDQILLWLPDWLGFLAWLLWGLFALLIVLLLAFGFVFMANLIGSPFYGLLSEQVERRVTGQSSGADLGWLSLVPRALGRELRKLGYFLPRLTILFVLGLVPLIQVVAPVLSALFAAWAMGLQFADFPADNQGLTFARVRHILGRRKGLALSFGGCVLLASMVPILNLFVMPAAVAGATLMWLRELRPLEAALTPPQGAGVGR